MKGKKGMSAIITTLIIIAIALVSMAIIWGVVKNLSKKTEEKAVLDAFLINIDIEKVTFDAVSNLTTIWVKRNTGEGNLVGLRFILSDGYFSETYDIDANLEELSAQTFYIIYNSSLSEIYISPIIELKSGKRIYGEILEYYRYASPSLLFSNYCGNGECGDGEDAQWCGIDCNPVCLNGICESNEGENSDTCIEDCPILGGYCGDSICESFEIGNCSSDCPMIWELETIGYFGFENGTQGWYFPGTNGDRSNTKSYVNDLGVLGGTYSGHLQDNSAFNSYFSRNFSFTGYDLVVVSFWYDVDGFEGLDTVRFYCDDIEVWHHTFPDTSNPPWSLNSTIIYASNSTFDDIVTLKFKNAGGSPDDDVYYDGINITGVNIVQGW